VHDGCRQRLVTTLLDLDAGRPAELATGLLPLDLRHLNAAGPFVVDAFALNAHADLADFDPSTPSLVAEAELLAVKVFRDEVPTARLLPRALNVPAAGPASVRVDGWRSAPPAGTPLSLRLVEVGGVPADVPLEGRALGGGAARVRLPRTLAARGGLVLDLDGCRVPVQPAAKRLRW
jgi:hypothetical protein